MIDLRDRCDTWPGLSASTVCGNTLARGERTLYRDVNVFGAPISVEEKLQRQAQVYADVLSAALKSGACRRFTMHGFVDPFSWLLARDDLKVVSEAPCIFDGDYQPKPAFFALRETLAGS